MSPRSGPLIAEPTSWAIISRSNAPPLVACVSDGDDTDSHRVAVIEHEVGESAHKHTTELRAERGAGERMLRSALGRFVDGGEKGGAKAGTGRLVPIDSSVELIPGGGMKLENSRH